MAKKKIYKDDGVTEDFEAEAAAPDETSEDAGSVADLLKSDDAGKADAAPAASSDVLSDNAASTSGGDSSTSEAAPAAEAASEAPAEAPTDAPQEPAEQPKLEEAHEEAKPAVEIAPEVFDELKAAANIVTPALNKFHALEAEIRKLEDEAKNRFAFARQKAVEFVGALETMFRRG